MVYLNLKGTKEAKEAIAPFLKELEAKGIKYRFKDYADYLVFDCDAARGFIMEVPVIDINLKLGTELSLAITGDPIGSENVSWHHIGLQFISSIYSM